MKVMVTGALGNIGSYAVQALIENGHEVLCFDLKTAKSEQTFNTLQKKHGSQVDVIWGDICNAKDVEMGVKKTRAVIHLAAMLPPASEAKPEIAKRINIGGTDLLIDAMQASADNKRFILASSTAVHGSDISRTPPIKVDTPFNPPDTYSEHKIANEAHLRSSQLDWTILRVAASPPTDPIRSKNGGPDLLFGLPVNARFELLHPADGGKAFANAVTCDDAIGKTLFVGGGQKNGCQLSGYDFVALLTRGIGMGVFPKKAFSHEAHGAHADWVDTKESQALLDYQQHTAQDFENEIKKNTGIVYYIIKLFSPVIRWSLMKKSPYLN